MTRRQPSELYPYTQTQLANLPGEEWKDIPGLENYFMVSDLGRIKRLPYELEYADGRIYQKKSIIIRPVAMEIKNHHVGDIIYFLWVSMTLFKLEYHFSVARLVYYCFVEPFAMTDKDIVILTKDGNGLNISPRNLLKATHHQKQKRIYDLGRSESPLRIEDSRKGILKSQEMNRKEVSQYSMEGKKIKTYSSIKAAAQAVSISPNHIGGIANGREISAGGYIWRFGREPSIDIEAMLHEKQQKHRQQFGQKVSQYDLSGKRIAVYPSVADAGDATGVHRSDITGVLSGRRKSAAGFVWKKGYGKAAIDLSGYLYGTALRAQKRARKVKQYTTDGKYVQTFPSIKAAAESVGVSSTTLIGALTGKQLTSAGYTWKYA